MRAWVFSVVAGLSLAAVGAACADEPGIDRWGIITAIDPITDDERVTAGVSSSNGLGLMFQCSEGRFGAVLVPNTPALSMEFITTDPVTTVVWRVDSDPAVTEEWRVLRGRAGSAYAAVSVEAEQLADSVMQGEEKIAVRIHGITEIMPLDNAREHVGSAISACH